MTDSKNSQDTSGGRHLNAIKYNTKLNVFEKLILHCFASELNFNGDFMEERYYTAARFAIHCSLSESKVRRTIVALREKGYIGTRLKKIPGQTNKYLHINLTDKLFSEASQFMDCVTLGLANSPVRTRPIAQYVLVPQPSITPSVLTPSKTTPTVCEQRARPRVYDPHTESDNHSIDRSEEIRRAYISNVSPKGHFLTTVAINKYVQRLCNDYGEDTVEKALADYVDINDTTLILFDRELLRNIVAESQEYYARNLLE